MPASWRADIFHLLKLLINLSLGFKHPPSFFFFFFAVTLADFLGILELMSHEAYPGEMLL